MNVLVANQVTKRFGGLQALSKIDLEVNADASGVLSRIDQPEGADVKVGEVLGVIEESASAAAAATADKGATEPAPAGASAPEPAAASQPAVAQGLSPASRR